MESELEFEDLKFIQEKDKVKVDFMKNYYFYLKKEELEQISNFRIKNGNILFECPEKKARNKLGLIIDRGFNSLKHKIRNKDTLYIHKNSEIPLIGTNEFGLIDRGTNLIEVKPLTGCNISCTFCSVNEGINDKKDIVVEEEYLAQEFKKLAKLKKHPVEANIGPQGEPLIYPKIVELVKDLKKHAKIVSVNTNGLLLNPNLIDELSKAGLTRINLSLHAINQEVADKLADSKYNIKHVLKMIKECEGKIDVMLTPVIIPGHNEDELDKIIELSKTIKNKLGPTLGIQNYLNYRGGRRLTDEMSWDTFYAILKEKSKKHNINLEMDKENFQILSDESLKKPFKKNHVIRAEIKSLGRNKGEVFAIYKDRCITVLKCPKTSGFVNIRIIRDKHNIFTGTIV